MGFDITRAISETFGNRATLLDRILSYLYFADVRVIEQSTSDEYGSGVSILGSKGNGDPEAGLLLACPLPTLPYLSRDAAEVVKEGGHELDLARYVDIMAKTWALSELDADSMNGPVALLAYRPDPLALSLRRMAEEGRCGASSALVFAPIGIEARPASCGLAICAVNLSDSTLCRPKKPR
ncbi:MAG: hypothetical protein GXP54_13000 [Deltaproteobacteria bacterium]|nr:hypothetical protein [Deltaproteobacteria bacterium]